MKPAAAQQPPPHPHPDTHWLAVCAAVAAGLAIGLNVGKVPVALTTLRSELGLTLVQAGWVSSTLSTVAVFCGAAVGMWVGRLGALRMVLAGLLLSALSSLLAAVAAAAGHGWATLLASRLLEGVGFMVVAVACPALITAASNPAQRRFALSMWSTYMPAGASLAMASAPWLLPHLGWRGLWMLTSLMLLAAAGALWFQRLHYGAASGTVTTRSDPGDSTVLQTFWSPVRQALAQPLPWLLALAFGVWATQHFALIVWLPTYLQEQRGMAAAPVALLTSAMLVACVPGNLLGGVLVQRGLPRGLLIAGAQVCTGLGAWVYSTESLPDGLRYAAAVWVSFAGGVIPAAVMASSSVLARSPQQVGTLQGLYLQGAQLGQFVGTPLIAATVAASGHWSSALWVTAPAALGGVGLGLLAHRLERYLRPPPAVQLPSTAAQTQPTR